MKLAVICWASVLVLKRRTLNPFFEQSGGERECIWGNTCLVHLVRRAAREKAATMESVRTPLGALSANKFRIARKPKLEGDDLVHRYS